MSDTFIKFFLLNLLQNIWVVNSALDWVGYRVVPTDIIHLESGVSVFSGFLLSYQFNLLDSSILFHFFMFLLLLLDHLSILLEGLVEFLILI